MRCLIAYYYYYSIAADVESELCYYSPSEILNESVDAADLSEMSEQGCTVAARRLAGEALVLY